MDVLSDVLRVIRLWGAIFFSAEFTAPYAIESPPPPHLAARLLPSAECLAIFHVLAQGQCWLALEGEAPLRLERGDVIIFPHSHPHVMTSRVGTAPTALDGILPETATDAIPHVTFGGGGSAARFVCGYLQCDQRINPLMGALPVLLWVRRRQGVTELESTGHGPGRRAVVKHADRRSRAKSGTVDPGRGAEAHPGAGHAACCGDWALVDAFDNDY